tara:strand:+ start:10465 stop:12378 length:1914 start_codon:yes stop_codon:yes gene_type:complete
MALDNCKLVGSGGLPNKVEVTATENVNNIPDQTLFIIPDEGFTVAAEDFSVFNVTYGANGNSLVYNPSGDIDIITLSNTTTAHSIDNKVKVVVNLVNSFSISSNTTVPIDLDGKGVEITSTIDVIPHIRNVAYSMPYPNLTVTIDKVSDNPPVINNTSKLTHDHVNVPFDITYLPCTIQANTPTKIATITVDSPASPGGGAFWSMVTPPYIDSIGGEASYGLSGVLKFELVEIVSSQVVQNNGAITKRVYELFYQNHESHNFSWPSNYHAIGTSAYTDACELVLTRPLYINPLESSTGNTIDFINMHDDIIIADGDVPDKTIDDGNVSLVNIGSLNPSGVYFNNDVGIITKSTEDEPNIISIQGTPGSQFTLLLQEDGHTKSGNGGLPTGTQTIPESGVFKTAMTDIEENLVGRGGGTATKNFDLTIQAVGTSAVSQSAGRAQQKPNTTIASGDANSITLRYVQPIGVANVKVTGSASGNIGTNTVVDTANTTNGADGSNCLAAQITGVGMSLVETQSHLPNVHEFVDFTMTRSGINNRVNSCVITGRVYFYKFGSSDVNINIDFNDIFEEDSNKSPIEFVVKSGKTNPTGAVTANVIANQSENLGDFALLPVTNPVTTAASKGVEFQITDLVASVT